LFIAVSVGAQLVRVVGLRVLAPVAAKLAIVLAVLRALLELHPVSVLIVVAGSILAAILILVLRCGNGGGPASGVESGAHDPKSQHPWGLF
jgi:hypothetical protein